MATAAKKTKSKATKAKKEATVEDQLKALFELQTIDSKIDEIQVLKGELPMEVKDLEDEMEGLETRVGNLQAEIKEMQAEQRGLRASKKEAEEMIKKYEKDQNNVKNNREFDALTKEIELQNLEIQLADKKIKEIAGKIDAKKAYFKESGETIDGKKKDLALKKKELNKIITETEKEEATLSKKSKSASKGLDERLITAYNRIRTTYSNRLAVVAFDRDSCGGCFNKIPPQRQLEIKQRKKIIVCEHCGRILVDPDMGGK